MALSKYPLLPLANARLLYPGASGNLLVEAGVITCAASVRRRHLGACRHIPGRENKHGQRYSAPKSNHCIVRNGASGLGSSCLSISSCSQHGKNRPPATGGI